MNWMTQVLVLFYRICTLKAQCSLSIKNPSEHTSPPTDTLSASLPQPYSGDAARYQEASKSFLYSSMCKLPFLLILQSVNILTLHKRKREKGETSACAQMRYSLLIQHGPESATVMKISHEKGIVSTQSAAQYCPSYFYYSGSLTWQSDACGA